MRQRSFAAFLSVFLIFLAVNLQGSKTDDKRLFPSDDTNSKIKVIIDTTSIEHIYLKTDEILQDTAAFWESDSAFKAVKRIREMQNQPVPDPEWEKNLSQIAKLSKKKRRNHPHLRMAQEVAERADYLNSTAVPYVSAFLPNADKMDFILTAHLTAHSRAYRFMMNNDLFIDVAHEKWNGSSKNILNNLVQVVFDLGFRECRGVRTEKPLDQKIYTLLEYLQIRGITTYVGYKAQDKFPAESVEDYNLLESDSDVTRLRRKLNDLFSKAKTMADKELRKSAVEIGVRGKAYTVVGAYMAQTIEEKLGLDALKDTISQGPLSFLKTYNKLTDDDKKIHDLGDEEYLIEDYVFGQRIEFDSDVLGEEKAVFIHFPASYPEGSNRYPVIYFLDGGSYFEPFAGMVKYMSLYGMIPEMIVVAIESGDRLKEFTYTKANEQTGNWPTSGGAETFQKFLSSELILYIDAFYRTHPFRILVGHSLAGLFAVDTLSRSPDLFQATIALSPSLYWNQFEWLKNAENFLDRYDSLKHFLFISGEKKDEEQTRYLDKFKDLVEAKALKDFLYEYRCFPEENHGSVAFPGLYSNLKQFFQGWQFPGEAWEKGPDKVKEHFQSLSERFGYPIPVTEEFLTDHAFHGLRRHKAPDEAIRLFELCLTLYPNSAESYEGIGEAYAQKGMKEKAIESYQKALELNPANANIRKIIEELKKK
jgi:predicted alpha/beta superfamily hydrolase